MTQTGTPKSPADLNAEVFGLLPDNTIHLITPYNARQIFLDVIASGGGGGGGSTGLTVGVTPIAGGTPGKLLYDNAGVVGETLGAGLTVGVTPIAGGTSGKLLYDNAGVVGEMLAAAVGLTTFNTKALAAAAMIAGTVAFLITGGFNVTGDGGGAMYERVINTARFPNYPNPTYPTYSFQSADGAYWQYIPAPTGWNSMVAGVKADGTDDSINVMNALLPFQNSSLILGGGDRTGVLLFPTGEISLHSPIIVSGSLSSAVKLQGQSLGSQGISASTTSFIWGGTGTYPSMCLAYGCNESQFENIQFVWGGNNLVNLVHVTADNTFGEHLTANVTAGANRTFTITNFSSTTAALSPGTSLGIGQGTANFEIVYVIAITSATTFTADCVNPHAGTAGGGGSSEIVGYGPPTNQITFRHCGFFPPPPYITNTESGVLVGNPLSPTVQAAQIVWDSCNFLGSSFAVPITFAGGGSPTINDAGGSGNNFLKNGAAIQLRQGATSTLPPEFFETLTYYVINRTNTTYQLSLTPTGAAINASTTGSGAHIFYRTDYSYSGLRIITGGNVKNWYITNCVFLQFQYGIAGESVSGSMEIFYPTFGNSAIADIKAQGASNLHITSAESEGGGNAFLIGTSFGAFAQGATLVQNSYQCGLPEDQFVIKWNGNLTMIGNIFFNAATSGPTGFLPPKIKNAGISTAASLTTLNPDAIMSNGNYFQYGSPTVPVFYDGSNVPFDYGTTAIGKEWRVVQLNDYCDGGTYPQKIGELSIVRTALDTTSDPMSPGIINNTQGLVGFSTESFTIPYTAFQTASILKTLLPFRIPPHTTITGVVLEVTTPFVISGGGTVTMAASTNLSATNHDFITGFDCTAATVKGLVDGDLGQNLSKASRPVPLGYNPPGQWTAGGESATISVSHASTNLSALTDGSVTAYFTYIKFR